MANKIAKSMPDESWYGNAHSPWNERYDPMEEVII
jgi:hypothetical protein